MLTWDPLNLITVAAIHVINVSPFVTMISLCSLVKLLFFSVEISLFLMFFFVSVSHKPIFYITTLFWNANDRVVIFWLPAVRWFSIEGAVIIRVTPFWWFSCSLFLSVSHKPVFHITTLYCNLNNPVIIFQFPRIVRRLSIEDALIILVTSFWWLFFSLLLSVYHRPIFSLRISFLVGFVLFFYQ